MEGNMEGNMEGILEENKEKKGPRGQPFMYKNGPPFPYKIHKYVINTYSKKIL